MRKHQQLQILELLNTISEAQEIERYKDCMEAAVSIAEFIINSDSKSKQTVILLNEYCDILNADIEHNKKLRKLEDHLSKIRSSVINELKPEKVEIVFFPYKSSMWDSLESIWLAAKNNNQCNVQVIPIPYYNRLPDNSLGDMQYEGNDFPNYVPIVDWQSYCIDTHLPDVVFIHNPYDQFNTVTTVHPDYYSTSLVKFTELLVYVPYYITEGQIYDSSAILPGVINADLVVLQSNDIQVQFADVLKKQAYHGLNAAEVKKLFKEKLLPLGSPKIDKAISSTRNDADLPDDWKHHIFSSNGLRKTVVFYNTSIEQLLTNTVKDDKIDDTYFNKLESVFTFFKDRDDSVLLWRPHPLLEQTVNTMRAPLIPRYKAILEQYHHERIGIYDDSNDLYRAIVTSDVYYGDWSSVNLLFLARGMPVLLQDMDPSTDTELQPYENMYDYGYYSDGAFRIKYFIEEFPLFSCKKEAIQSHYSSKFANSDGTAGEKIVSHILNTYFT